MGNPENGWEKVEREAARQMYGRQTIIVWTNEMPDLPYPYPTSDEEEMVNDQFLRQIYPEWTI